MIHAIVFVLVRVAEVYTKGGIFRAKTWTVTIKLGTELLVHRNIGTCVSLCWYTCCPQFLFCLCVVTRVVRVRFWPDFGVLEHTHTQLLLTDRHRAITLLISPPYHDWRPKTERAIQDDNNVSSMSTVMLGCPQLCWFLLSDVSFTIQTYWWLT